MPFFRDEQALDRIFILNKKISIFSDPYKHNPPEYKLEDNLVFVSKLTGSCHMGNIICNIKTNIL